MTSPLQRDATALKPKRSRICGPQSKNGCLTCKARRIKCDEERPTCLRCSRSGRDCEGYKSREGSPPQAARSLARPSTEDNLVGDRQLSLNTSSPSWALKMGCASDEQQHRLAQRGMHLLSFDSFNRFGPVGPVLDILLPQLCLSMPTVNVAVTALGAIHDMQDSFASGSLVDETLVASKYRDALRALQRDLSTQPNGPITLIIVCIVLSLAEILLQQESNALFHLRGASNLLQNQRNAKLASVPARSDTLDLNLASLEDEIRIILRTVDFQTCSYAWSKSPDLPAISPPLLLPPISNLNVAHVILVQLVHACYAFTSTAQKFQYRPQSAAPSVYIEQGRHNAHLSTWVEQFNFAVLPMLGKDPTSLSQDQSYSHALTLRMTALSTLIYLSCILCPYETAFNAHVLHFQQIITDGEAIMSIRHRGLDHSFDGLHGHRFTTGPGLIQPLFLAAFKYRHPLYRRRAIALLSIAGREGPWYGRREARVTSRIMELEEKRSQNSLPNSIREQPTPIRVLTGAGRNNGEGISVSSSTKPIPGSGVVFDSSTAYTQMPSITQAFSTDELSTEPRERLIERAAHVVEMAEPDLINVMGMNSENATSRPSNRVTIRLSRCKDIEAMLAYPCGHGPGQEGNLDSHLQGPCEHNPHWERWEEVLEF